MIKRRQFFKYASLSTVGFAFTVKRSALAHSPASQTSQTLTNLKTFSFKVPTIDARGQLRDTHQNYAQFFSEHLSDATGLEMVAISSGHFVMGSSQDETSDRAPHQRTEFPRHQVKVQEPFFMSKFPITQAQWAAVAALPRVKRELNPDPSHFQGRDRPVESISWLDAVEFCERLSKLTHRHYSLPSEAQWEYACRAGTHTPFNTGETITSDLADYVGSYTYRQEKSGTYRQATTPVGTFSHNAFGLQDMHGNVWEWCTDSWHESYRGAPRDGKPWITRSPLQAKVIRGGSWLDAPTNLRSASRSGYSATSLNRIIGFRVSCTSL